MLTSSSSIKMCFVSRVRGDCSRLNEDVVEVDMMMIVLWIGFVGERMILVGRSLV